MEPSSSSSDKGFSKKRSKSIVAAVRSFFGRQLSVPGGEEAAKDDESDSSAKLNSIYSSDRKQEEAWMQACYNAIALLFLFVTGCILLAVYYVLESFLHPLMWAVLVGMVLHPFKHMSTSAITQWLRHTRMSGVPLSLAAVFLPLLVFNWLSRKLEHIVLKGWKVITGLALALFVLLVMYMLSLPVYIFRGLSMMLHSLVLVETLLTGSLYAVLLTLTIGFLLLLFLSKGREKYSTSLRILSSLLWFLVVLNLSVYVMGTVAVPLVLLLFVVAAILSVVWKKKSKTAKIAVETDVLEEGHYLNILPSASSLYDDDSAEMFEEAPRSEVLVPTSLECEDVGVVSEVGGAGVPGRVSFEEMKVIHEAPCTPSKVPKPSELSLGGAGTGAKPNERSVGGAGARQSSSLKHGSSSKLSSGDRTDGFGLGPRRSGRIRSAFRKTQAREQAHEQSNHVFVALLIAYFVVMCWHYPLVIFLVSPVALWALFKHALFSKSSTIVSRTQDVVRRTIAALKDKAWLVAPPPVPTLMRMFLHADRAILRIAVRSTGSLVSAFIIIGLVVGVATTVVVLLLKVQVELSHYMTVGAKVWNMTLEGNPQLSEWINTSRTNESLTFSFEVFAKQSYQYGRIWLAQKIHSLIGNSKEGTSLVEKQVLDLFDELYHWYFLKDSTSNSMGGVWTSSKDMALFAEIKDLILNNYEIILSMLKSLGSIITVNFSVALSFLYALLQLLFSGGSFLFNMIVFVSTLFYLLSWSDEQYLPVQWVLDLLPHLAPPTSEGDEDKTTKQGEAFQRAIRGVFHASCRRAFFYSVYTWLTHTILAVPVSILPSVLAGVAGAIPFVGPYWISLPAILELWLIDSSPLAAIALLVFSLLPMLFVDALINGEIEGGHPYLTGLAIAGGIYFAGLEGALLGPILLCCLLFFMDIYGDVFNSN